MAIATGELRIKPNVEMFSVDMAEIVDAAMLRSGVIQGCGLSLVGGAVTIEGGRMIIGGRLGVVTGGTIELPTISVTQTCWILAVCDLANPSRSFYLTIVDSAGLETLNKARTTDGTFNVSNGLDYITLGSVTVDPARGVASDLQTNESSTAKKGPDVRNDLVEKSLLKDYMIRVPINTGSHSCADNTGTVNYEYMITPTDIPEGYTPFFVYLATTQNYQFYCWYCDFTDDTHKVVDIRIQKRSGTGGTLWPWIIIICVKDIT